MSDYIGTDRTNRFEFGVLVPRYLITLHRSRLIQLHRTIYLIMLPWNRSNQFNPATTASVHLLLDTSPHESIDSIAYRNYNIDIPLKSIDSFHTATIPSILLRNQSIQHTETIISNIYLILLPRNRSMLMRNFHDDGKIDPSTRNEFHRYLLVLMRNAILVLMGIILLRLDWSLLPSNKSIKFPRRRQHRFFLVEGMASVSFGANDDRPIS